MKTALFFGSFNPVHIGHLAIANYITEYTDSEQLWFVVSPQNPLKERATLLKEHHRLEMIRLAIEDFPKFKVSDIEFKLSKPSFTAHTLIHLSEKYPDRKFSLILGSDNLEGFHKWKSYEWILENYELLVYPRPQTDPSVWGKYPQAKKIDAPQMEISSTFIRNAVREKKDVRYFMPLASWQYLKEMHFYEKI